MRRVLYTCVALAATLFIAGTATAQAAGHPESWTVRFQDQVSIEQDVHPCTGQVAELTIVQSGDVHFSLQPDGNVHFTGTLRGTFSADALPTDGTVDATGSFVVWFGGNGLLVEDGSIGGAATGRAQTAFTWSGSGVNADGSTFRWHANGNAV
jgi:hypothetical protein